MVFALNRVLAQNHFSKQTNAVKINVSYDPTGGVKGGLKFCSIVSSGTAGIYYVQLKNIFYRKDGITSINDGDKSFPMSNVVYFTGELVGQAPNPTIANAGLQVSNTYDAANNRFIVYTFDATGLKDIPVGSRLSFEITYKKFVRAN
jgi:hypothetical protein